MGFVAIFAALTLAFGAGLSMLAYASDDVRLDARAVALNLLWAAALAGLTTLLLRGAWALASGG